jgi:hypothetical protein
MNQGQIKDRNMETKKSPVDGLFLFGEKAPSNIFNTLKAV